MFLKENVACNATNAFFTNEDHKRYTPWSCQKVIEPLTYLSYNIYIRFGTKIYRQVVGIPVGTNCAHIATDLALFCYERDFIKSRSDSYQVDIIEAFNSTSRYLDHLLNTDNSNLEILASQVYPSEFQLYKANRSENKVPFLDLHLSISNGFVSSKI